MCSKPLLRWHPPLCLHHSIHHTELLTQNISSSTWKPRTSTSLFTSTSSSPRGLPKEVQVQRVQSRVQGVQIKTVTPSRYSALMKDWLEKRAQASISALAVAVSDASIVPTWSAQFGVNFNSSKTWSTVSAMVVVKQQKTYHQTAAGSGVGSLGYFLTESHDCVRLRENNKHQHLFLCYFTIKE